VDTGPGPSRGNTLVDLKGQLDGRAVVQVAVDAEPAAVVGFIIDRVSSLR
jgi:inosine-uridine nucleoside N-ribohydrolase